MSIPDAQRRHARPLQLSRRQFLLLAGLAPLVLGGCGRATGTVADGERQHSFFCFDTVCAVGGTMSQRALDATVEHCQRFEQLLSRTIATSDVARVNAAGGAPVAVEAETAELLRLALGYCEESGGLFDITIGAASTLWDFHEGIVPEPEKLAEAVRHIDYRALRVEGQTVTLADPKAKIDVGGIAKGYVADVLIDELAKAGVTSAFVNLGGNVKVLGTKPDGSPWRIGVRDPHPNASEESSIARVALEGGSVVTSGLYERQFEQDGRRYWHILDPRTGYPVESELIAATIVSERSIDGDGYTKPFFMMGRDETLAWVERHPELSVLLVDARGELAMQPPQSFELL